MSEKYSYDVTDFDQQVVGQSRSLPVVADFWAAWCGPCRILTPILERLAAQAEGKWLLAKVNTEEQREKSIAYNIQSIPNVKLFSDGKVIAEFVGALPEYAVTQWLKQHLPSKNITNIERARTMMQQGQTTEARKILEQILLQEDDNQEVKALLAKSLLFEDRLRAAELIQGVDDPRYDETSETVRTMLYLVDASEHPDRLAPTPTRQQYLDAIGHIRRHRFEEALEAFINIIRNDRYYDDDWARKACIAIFKYLGEENQITMKYRKEFSGALYV